MRPTDERPQGHHTPGPSIESTSRQQATDHDERDRSAVDGHPDGEQAAAWCRRRRAGSQRLAILDDGRADPLDGLALVDDDVILSARELAAWRATWTHLRAHGYDVNVPAAVRAAGARERCSCAVPS